MEDFFHSLFLIFFKYGIRFSGFVPANSFDPIVTVSGRSVEFLRVIQGIFNTVASSVIPPESVITAFEFFTKKINSKYPIGSTTINFEIFIFSQIIFFKKFGFLKLINILIQCIDHSISNKMYPAVVYSVFI